MDAQASKKVKLLDDLDAEIALAGGGRMSLPPLEEIFRLPELPPLELRPDFSALPYLLGSVETELSPKPKRVLQEG